MLSDLHPINLLQQAGAPSFVTDDPVRILEEITGYFEEATGRRLSPSETEMYLLETAAYMFSIRAAEDQQGFENCFVAWAQKQFLEARGIGRNTKRLPPSPATTVLRFETEEPALTRLRIPPGSRVSGNVGQVQFRTIDVGYIEIGETHVDLKAEATAPGSTANGLPLGSLSAMVDLVPGVSSVTNLTETGNGADLEDLERYRARVAQAFERIGEGVSQERYVSDVLGWNARVIAVKVIRPQPGYVHIFPLMDTGAPNAEELASLLNVFDTSNTHQGDFIHTFAPTREGFTFPLALTLSDPDAAAPARAAAEAVLDEWRRTLGGYIAPSELIRAAKAVPGVIEADVPGLEFAAVEETAWRDGSISSLSVEVL